MLFVTLWLMVVVSVTAYGWWEAKTNRYDQDMLKRHLIQHAVCGLVVGWIPAFVIAIGLTL